MVYLITRHAGALEWLRKRVTVPTIHLEHMDTMEAINNGDIVIGTLSVNLAAVICERGARYIHLQIDLPKILRGKELSSQQMSEFGATLVDYVVIRPCAVDATLAGILQLEG